MGGPIKKKSLFSMVICGILGSFFMGASDWLMIYGDPTFSGNLAWLTAGAAVISPERNAAAMALAFPAVVFYMIGLLEIRSLLTENQSRRNYSFLTVLGMTPWLCLHLFYTMILFLFGWMNQNGDSQLALSACEAMFTQFSWLIPVGEVLMLLPFIHLLIIVASGKSTYSRWMALNSPLLIFAVLKGITMGMPDCSFRLAFTNGLMSESMLLWFTVFLFVPQKKSRA